ncbi:helix-turn-helix domain-containing protein [Deferribacter autotrophicus]|uniref:Helix-turn-helix domain-containing protein n=1 Tax=Deferribacter autotrophicus TaxID=500465 RepID=A0A5A8F2E9_9BACT|nr:helix-turn-helix domain-containing protein [Deferribacter autotrophicus]KAA0258250.1 helix-turn-helix domain-containing protein [Deferribacter autotrophicus]
MQKEIKEMNLEILDNLITLDDFCRIFNISKHTIYKYTSLRMIPYYKLFGKIYFDKRDLLNFIKKQKKA